MNKIIMAIAGLIIATNVFAEPLILHGIQISEENINEIQKMTEKEKEYLFDELGKIRKGMSLEEVTAILGAPSRNLGAKVNWWVQPDQKKIRVGVYFTNNRAAEVVLDGGWGSFYYRQEL